MEQEDNKPGPTQPSYDYITSLSRMSYKRLTEDEVFANESVTTKLAHRWRISPNAFKIAVLEHDLKSPTGIRH
jgi:hypothetical protein